MAAIGASDHELGAGDARDGDVRAGAFEAGPELLRAVLLRCFLWHRWGHFPKPIGVWGHLGQVGRINGIVRETFSATATTKFMYIF